MNTKMFHYAFPVRDLVSTRRFYGEILGCREGRSTESWIDFDFFGNQLSAHVSRDLPDSSCSGKVEEIKVPIPHFGCILSWQEFQSLASRLERFRMSFVITPRVRFEGKPSEQVTMFLNDFSGNSIEFKAFKNPQQVFES